LLLQKTSKDWASRQAYKGCPKFRNIDRRIQISVTMPTTMPTSKLFAIPVRFPVNRMNAVALVARLRGIGRIHRDYFHAFLKSLVFEERPKLEECPTIRASPFGLIAWLLIGSVSDTRQILNRNNRTLRFRGLDNPLADVVV
jgi:hypothetical protein